jgi:glucose dehydrogenase
MRRPSLILAVLLALVGLVWLGQGIGLIGGSVMSGSSFWAIVGLVLLVVAGILVAREVRRAAK